MVITFHTYSMSYRGKWGNAGQGVMPDNAVLANRGILVIFHYPEAIVT